MTICLLYSELEVIRWPDKVCGRTHSEMASSGLLRGNRTLACMTVVGNGSETCLSGCDLESEARMMAKTVSSVGRQGATLTALSYIRA